MSATLSIALANITHRGEAGAAAVADVVAIEPSTGTQLRGVVIPSGYQSRTTVEVLPGRYLVQVVLPSGEMIDQEVSVLDGGAADVLLQGEVTPHEWLGWQRFSPERATLWDTVRVATAMPEVWLADGHQWLEQAPSSGDPLSPSHHDDRTSAFEINDHPWETRAWAVVRRGDRTDVVALPVPWDLKQPHTVQIAVPHDATLPLSLAVLDPDLGPMLGYVSAGALPSARKILRRSPEWRKAIAALYDKDRNPFGAAVAGYVLLKTTRDPGPHDWHEWINNLALRFPWVPDGAVLCGTIALRNGDHAAARHYFHDAVSRGIPVLTGCLLMLHDGLLSTQASPGDQADLDLTTVRRTIARVEVAQPFSTLRFDDEDQQP